MSKRQEREKRKLSRSRQISQFKLREKHQLQHESSERKRRMLDESRRTYLSEWTPSAKQHKQNDDYDWMAGGIDGYERVLEVGCGNGESTLAIVRRTHTVVAIEENSLCVDATVQTLHAANVECVVQHREQVCDRGDQYALKYSVPAINIPNGGVAVLEGDVLEDAYLRNWLLQVGPFDAVVCWLVGTHGARREGYDTAVLPEARGKPGMYRLQVQNTVYMLADQVLRIGGILHIVDRGEVPNEAGLHEDLLDSHREQAKPTNLAVEGSEVRSLPRLQAEGGIEIVLTPGTSGRMPTNFEPALVSITSRKAR